MLTIYNFSEGQEDCFYISIGKEKKTNILVDGGNGNIDLMINYIQKLHYVVLTHIDQDHIRGLIKLFKNKESCKDIIIVYNRFINGEISYKQAEEFELLTKDYHNIVSYKEYQENRGDIIFLSVSQRKKLKKAKGQIYITFLSPQKEKVQKLYEYYNYYKYNSRKTKHSNSKIVNQSSIMFILEYDNYVILMTGDGYISDIMKDITILADEEQTNDHIKAFDLIKIPHHGSKENNEELGKLLEKIPCNRFIITNTFTKRSSVRIEEKLIENLGGKLLPSSFHEENKSVDFKMEDIKMENESIGNLGGKEVYSSSCGGKYVYMHMEKKQQDGKKVWEEKIWNLIVIKKNVIELNKEE